MKKNNRKFLYIFLIILVLVLIPFVSFFALSPLGHYVSGDIIKNFKFESIAGSTISPGGGVYDNKLKFESGPIWTITKDDLDLIESYIDANDTVYLHYRLYMHNRMNVYTNVRLLQACSHLTYRDTSYLTGEFSHLGLFGDEIDYWKAWITWSHWDFFGDSNIREFNERYNSFSGDVKMTFDIIDTTIPNHFYDDRGNSYDKDFEYMNVGWASVEGRSRYGKLSEDNPDIVNVDPQTYDEETDERSENSDPTYGDSVLEYTWDPNIVQYFAGVDDWGRIQAPSPNASLNPTKKDGSPIYSNSQQSEESQEDCALHYNIGGLTPYVAEYKNQLGYTWQKLVIRDQLIGEPVKVEDRNHRYSITQPVALHVQNQYIQSDLIVCFDVWTSYEIEIKHVLGLDLGNPEEFYSGLTWLSIVSGHGGGEDEWRPWWDFERWEDIIWLIIMIIIVAVGVYIFVKIGIPVIKGVSKGIKKVSK